VATASDLHRYSYRAPSGLDAGRLPQTRADATGARGRAPEAEEVAARGGGSRLVTEARRLVRALAG
jgi:hypothetical protein